MHLPASGSAPCSFTTKLPCDLHGAYDGCYTETRAARDSLLSDPQDVAGSDRTAQSGKADIQLLPRIRVIGGRSGHKSESRRSSIAGHTFSNFCERLLRTYDYVLRHLCRKVDCNHFARLASSVARVSCRSGSPYRSGRSPTSFFVVDLKEISFAEVHSGMIFLRARTVSNEFRAFSVASRRWPQSALPRLC
jgi:hypothetical protein